jgi:flagellar hook-basal body complex protein FliE
MRIGPIPSSLAVETTQASKLDDLQNMLAGGLNAVRSNSGVMEGAPGDFSAVLTRAVTDVEGKLRAAEQERQKVLTGETNNLHQATIASSEAGVAFSLMIEVRNKLVESYQELMRMQV